MKEKEIKQEKMEEEEIIEGISLDIALDFNDYPKLTASSSFNNRRIVIASKKRGGVMANRRIEPNWDEGIISITCCWNSHWKEIGAIVNLIPRKRQLMKDFLIGNKRSKLYKDTLMREIFSLFVGIYGKEHYYDSWPDKNFARMVKEILKQHEDKVLIDFLEEGNTYMTQEEMKNRLFYILDDLFQKNDKKIIDKLSEIYQEAMRLSKNQSFRNCIDCRFVSLAEREEWRGFIKHSTNQFFRLEDIVREFLIKNGFSKLPKKDDIIDRWIKKYPSESETKPVPTYKGSTDWADSKAFEDRGNASQGKCKAVLESWGFWWLQEDAPDMEGNILSENFILNLD
ncbi:hypothetical protein [Akkermansia massiliensis]|uniref:hypothetical protein n=1 Tax=Akkermansia massiliensis TaxID=2927224 RepID=UPI00202EEBD3|nr:hypothetical protein [Akkermansia sp. B2-R-115]MCM0685304.1 hypothetical protein [Akkermansia sp. B2-R-115]